MTPTVQSDDLTIDQRLALLRQMREIRGFEDECHRLFAQGLVRGSTHLGQGQEAVSVGVCAALRPEDTVTCTYRGHAATLAKGAPLDEAFGEIMGKARGLCGGKGGSMHLTDLRVGVLGSFAIIGGHLPISVGAAFAARYRGSEEIAVCFFGDGTTNIGAFHEALNLASIWRLPVVFVCENNLYGEYSPLEATTPITVLADRADSYAMAKARVDGNDVLAVRDTMLAAAERARAGEGPTLIEALTYRQRGHSRSDPGKSYRPADEIEAWMERDPIVVLERALAEAGAPADDLQQLATEAERAVLDAMERAQSWDEPALDALREDVYA